MAYKEIPDITLKMIINAGIIKIGTKVYSSPNNEIIGTLDKEGAITFEIDNEMKTFPFSTPIRNYKIINGLHLPTYGEAIWNYPEGDFMYGKFHLKSVEYNVSKLNG